MYALYPEFPALWMGMCTASVVCFWLTQFRVVCFLQALCAELDNVDKHYVRREIALQSEIAALDRPGVSKEDKMAALAEIRKGIQDLTNFAALNYSAVLKAVKKRNRRLQMACGDSVVTAPTRDFLVGRRFFASGHLAKIVDTSHSLTQVCYAITLRSLPYIASVVRHLYISAC